MKTPAQPYNLMDHLPLWRIEDDLLILKDGRVAMGFEFSGAPFEELSAVAYSQFQQLFNDAFNSLPHHYLVQKIDLYTNHRYPFGRQQQGFTEKGPFEKEAIRYFAERPVLRQKSYLFIISNTNKPTKKNALNTLFARGKFKVTDTAAFANLNARKTELTKHAQAFTASLSTFNAISLFKMQAAQLRLLYAQLLNLDFNLTTPVYNKELLNEKNALIIGDKKLNIISILEMGEECHPYAENDFGLPAPFLYSLGIYLQFPHITTVSFIKEDTATILQQYDRTRNITQATLRLSTQAGALKVQEISDFTEEVRRNDLKFMGVNVQVLLFSNSESSREKQVQAVVDAMRKTYGIKPLVETFDTATNFFASLPGSSAEAIRWITLTTDIGACLINPTTEFLSRESGDYICDRFRNLVYVDLFDRRLNNQNAIVIGPSGSGKSFAMGHFMLQRYERKERQIIIDVGGSYKNMLEAMGSNDPKSDVRYFEYAPETPISFNPFLVPTDETGQYVFSDDKANVLLTLFGLIIKESTNDTSAGFALGKSEWPVYEQLFSNYYTYLNQVEPHHRETPSLQSFFKWTATIQDRKDLDRINFANTLVCFQPFIDGRYKTLLNSEEEMDLADYRLVCFDMARVKDYKALYPIVSFLLIELAMDVIRKFPQDRKYIVMDEAWSMLSDAMGAFVEYLYRTIRKNNGSMTIVTQGVDELASDIGTIIKGKCETKIVLNHSSAADIEKVGFGLGLTTSDMDKVASIRVNNECREIFIKQGNQSAVFVLEVPPFEHAVITSHPVERNHLNHLKKIYGNLFFAVKQWEEDKQNGFFDNK